MANPCFYKRHSALAWNSEQGEVSLPVRMTWCEEGISGKDCGRGTECEEDQTKYKRVTYHSTAASVDLVSAVLDMGYSMHFALIWIIAD